MKPVDTCNAFVPGEMIAVDPNRTGKLSSLTFAVKELYDVKGFVTGAGNPRWKNTHPAAQVTAPSVEMLLNEGATLVGKTISDEMAFSLDGENVHYGTPLNSKCPGRIPGGSSSGSAAAVAGGLVDFALGTDTAGSMRIPASYCGIYGFRPTHGAVSLQGVHPMAPNFDVAGWFARTPDVLAKVGSVLLGIEIPEFKVNKFVIARDLFDTNGHGKYATTDDETCHAHFPLPNPLDGTTSHSTRLQETAAKSLVIPQAGEGASESLREFHVKEHRVASKYDAFMQRLSKFPVEIVETELGKPDFLTWIEVLRNIQWWELNQAHGEWIFQNLDTFGDEIRGRLEKISSVTRNEMEEKRRVRKQLIIQIENMISPGTLIVFPTAPGVAPLKGRSIDEARASRINTMRHTCIATVAGLPQISMPLIEQDGCPIGISLLGARGQDGQLLAAAQVFGKD